MEDIVERIKGLRYVHVPQASQLFEEAIAEIERLRITDEEREAVSRAATFMRKWGGAPNNADANTLLLMLARLRY